MLNQDKSVCDEKVEVKNFFRYRLSGDKDYETIQYSLKRFKTKPQEKKFILTRKKIYVNVNINLGHFEAIE